MPQPRAEFRARLGQIGYAEQFFPADMIRFPLDLGKIKFRNPLSLYGGQLRDRRELIREGYPTAVVAVRFPQPATANQKLLQPQDSTDFLVEAK